MERDPRRKDKHEVDRIRESSSADGALPADTVADTRDLLRFLPNVLIDRLNGKTTDKWREGKEPLAAAFLFLDIFGMHHLSEALPTTQTADGQGAAEQKRQTLLDALVTCFGRLVEIARTHGGAPTRDPSAPSYGVFRCACGLLASARVCCCRLTRLGWWQATSSSSPATACSWYGLLRAADRAVPMVRAAP